MVDIGNSRLVLYRYISISGEQEYFRMFSVILENLLQHI